MHRHNHNQRFKKLRFYRVGITVVATLGLIACGGGSESGSISGDTAAAIDTGAEVANSPMQLSGTIVVEERNGKTVLDGWFVQSTASESSLTPTHDTFTDDSCVLGTLTIDQTQAGAAQDAENSWNELQSGKARLCPTMPYCLLILTPSLDNPLVLMCLR